MPASQDIRNPTANSTARGIELGLGAQTKSSRWANVGHNDEEACTVFPGRMGLVVKNVEYKRIYDEEECSRITIRQCWMERWSKHCTVSISMRKRLSNGRIRDPV